MLSISSESDIEVCRELWQELMPAEQLTDLWDVRICFANHFQRKLCFVVARENNKPVGLIPLCFIEEHGYWGYFPGEIWEKKTWLEQNRIIASSQEVADQMFRWLEDNHINYSLRYLHTNPYIPENRMLEDEIGYLFFPPEHKYTIEEYYTLFSRKSLKTVHKDVNKLYNLGVTFRFDDLKDFDRMVAFNIERFGTQSYFANNKFARSFEDLMNFLKEKEYLRIITVIIDGQIAAVDMGCLYNGSYTLLAGGTNVDFPGIAKLINLWHLQSSCTNRYNMVDFLCGDFSWKKLFHLTPRPLYQLSNIKSLESDVVLDDSVKAEIFKNV